MTETEKVLRVGWAEGHPGVMHVVIDRPPVNAITLAAYREILGIFSTIADDPDVRCVVLSSACERAFIGGSDVNELKKLAPASAVDRSRTARRCFEAVRHTPVPVIAAVNGPAYGSGLAIVSVCDVVVCSERARFALPEINVGVMGGTKHLTRLVPLQMMRWMAFTGAKVDGHTLARIGSVHSVVPEDQLLAAAFAIADDIAAKSPAAVRMMKEAMDLTEEMDLGAGYHAEQLCTAIISSHPQAKEAASAFLEKRKPDFTR